MEKIAKTIRALRLEIAERYDYSPEIENVCQKLKAIENGIDVPGPYWKALSAPIIKETK